MGRRAVGCHDNDSSVDALPVVQHHTCIVDSCDPRPEPHRLVGQRRLELGGECTHAEPRYGGSPDSQHPENHVETPARYLEQRIQLDACEQRLPERLDHQAGEPGVRQTLRGRHVRPTEKLGHRVSTNVENHPSQAGLVDEGSDWGDEGWRELQRTAQRITDPVEPAAPSNQRSWFEQAKLERADSEALLDLGIRGEHDLEATIELVAVHLVGADTSTDAVGRLEHGAVHTRPDEVLGARKSGEPGAHDDNVDHVRRPSKLTVIDTSRSTSRTAADGCRRVRRSRPGRRTRRLRPRL